MTYTSITAIIFTFHHLSTVAALLLAVIITAPMYFFILRKRPYRAITLFFTFVLAFLISTQIAENIFLRPPMSIEFVSAG